MIEQLAVAQNDIRSTILLSSSDAFRRTCPGSVDVDGRFLVGHRGANPLQVYQVFWLTEGKLQRRVLIQ